MSYTNSFKYDVFVSYAHADDAPIMGAEYGWVKQFVDDLTKQLTKNLGNKNGESPIVWMDTELASNIPLDTSLTEVINQTATFLIIMSRAYLKSEWCQTERNQFLKILKDKSSDTRVFIIEISEINRNTYPGEINKNLVPRKFWQKNINSRVAETLGVTDRPNDRDFYTRLLEVSTDIADELDRIKIKSGGFASPTPQVEKGNIFLAQTTDDLDDKREELKGFLKDFGYRILPEESVFKEDMPALKNKLLEDLDKSLLYVQLLSKVPGKLEYNINDRITKFQFALASQQSKVKMINWRTSDFDPDKIADGDFKKILESESVMAGGFEEFKNAVLTAATKTGIPPPPPHPSDTKFVYICTNSADKEYAKEIILKAIAERNPKRKNINCVFPLDYVESFDNNQDKESLRAWNELNILESDAALLVYCKSDPGTVFSQLRYCLKTSAKKDPPLEILALYDGPPIQKSSIPITIENKNFVYLNCRESLKEFTEKFLNMLDGNI